MNGSELLQQQMNIQQHINNLLHNRKNLEQKNLERKYLEPKLEGFVDGSSGNTSKKTEEELKEIAESIGKKLTTEFNQEIQIAKAMNSLLKTIATNSEYTSDLLKQYIQRNKFLENDITNSHSDILTNDRKTYYEKNALQSLFYWRIGLMGFYYFLCIVLLLGFLSTLAISTFKKIILFILFVFYPFYIQYITYYIYDVWNHIKLLMPKNVYNNL
jgi:hypothetical protein